MIKWRPIIRRSGESSHGMPCGAWASTSPRMTSVMPTWSMTRVSRAPIRLGTSCFGRPPSGRCDREMTTKYGRERTMKRLSLSLCALVLTVALEPARAQTTLDVSKITCEQFRLYKITDPRDIALWINGYFNGQRKNTVLDTQKLKDHFDKLKDYCILNPKLRVLDTTQKVLERNK